MSLAGVGVLVTRPAHQAEPLCDALLAAGARPYRLPAIDIRPAPASDQQVRALAAAAGADWWLFVSPNAVEHGLRALAERGIQRSAQTRVGAVGAGTARALRSAGLDVDLVPSGASSGEGLLAEPELGRLDGQRVVLFRGIGGRDQLPEGLRQRGAELHMAEVYQRARPAVDPAPVARALATGQIQVVVVTSVNGLENLIELLGIAPLREVGLVTVSERILQAARRLGWQGGARISGEPGDTGVVQAITQWVQAQQR